MGAPTMLLRPESQGFNDEGKAINSGFGWCVASRTHSKWSCSHTFAAHVLLADTGHGFANCCPRSLGELLQCVLQVVQTAAALCQWWSVWLWMGCLLSRFLCIVLGRASQVLLKLHLSTLLEIYHHTPDLSLAERD